MNEDQNMSDGESSSDDASESRDIPLVPTRRGFATAESKQKKAKQAKRAQKYRGRLREKGLQYGILPIALKQAADDAGGWDAWMKANLSSVSRASAYAPRPGMEKEYPAYTGNVHTLKTDPAVFTAMEQGLKFYEIRLDDRGFKEGDVLHLKETLFSGADMKEGKTLEYTGREMRRRVTHILSGYGLADSWVILSVVPCEIDS